MFSETPDSYELTPEESRQLGESLEELVRHEYMTNPRFGDVTVLMPSADDQDIVGASFPVVCGKDGKKCHECRHLWNCTLEMDDHCLCLDFEETDEVIQIPLFAGSSANKGNSSMKGA